MSHSHQGEPLDDIDVLRIELDFLGSSGSSAISSQSMSDFSSLNEEPLANPHHISKRRRASAADCAVKRSKPMLSHGAEPSGPSAVQIEHAATSDWMKSVLVRPQPRANEVVSQLLYTFVKLPGPNVESCVAAICAKMDIPFTVGMPVSWLDSKTQLRGPFDHAFLQNIPNMQDFVIDVISMGVSGGIGITLEM